MSEKQFELYKDDYFFGVYDNVTQEKINILKSIDLLNSLVEENEQLKQYKLYDDNKRLQNIIADLKEENKELKTLLEIEVVPELINCTGLKDFSGKRINFCNLINKIKKQTED